MTLDFHKLDNVHLPRFGKFTRLPGTPTQRKTRGTCSKCGFKIRSENHRCNPVKRGVR